MKKYTVMCAAVCAAIAMSSCGGAKESAYKKMYEKAQAAERAQAANDAVVEAPVVAPIVTTAPEESTVMDNVDNATYRQENVTLINGAGLKAYSVVVGSFTLQTNAENLQSILKTTGYDAQIVFNSERNMYRVVASTYDDKATAVGSRNQLRSKYPDAWLLYKN